MLTSDCTGTASVSRVFLHVLREEHYLCGASVNGVTARVFQISHLFQLEGRCLCRQYTVRLQLTRVWSQRVCLLHVHYLTCDCRVNTQWSKKPVWWIRNVMMALTHVCVSTDRNTVQLPHIDVSVLEPLVSRYWVSGVSCAEISSNPVFLSQFWEVVSGSTFPANRHADSGLPHN